MLQEAKATRREILLFLRDKEAVSFKDLMNKFGYTYQGARMKMWRLEKGKFVAKVGILPGTFCLTENGHRRLEYYEREGSTGNGG